MKKVFKDYTIPFVGLKIGKHQFEYELDNSFFELFDYQEFNAANVKANLLLTKKANMLELDFEVVGKVNLNCDLTLEPYNQDIKNKLSIVVKFGDDYEEVNEELLILPHGEYEVEVQQYIYEAVILGLPAKRIHPGVEDGTLDSEILNKLQELKPQTSDEKEETKDEDEIDPRWDKLKGLLKD
ncbi:YceD family protein [Psychroflexus salis]|uniref:DNA-binding protein n=1 Tax=Psychroflexus salis TaxID=1526574 RepID=A0A916ZZ80_9FLAO|nr:DUF177 domain-containing protein [Psychroflexus salis]GGE18656.1 DNA-binding protein [Psychroflexus salis]